MKKLPNRCQTNKLSNVDQLKNTYSSKELTLTYTYLFIKIIFKSITSFKHSLITLNQTRKDFGIIFTK